MRILFSSRPAYGHVFPMLPLAAAARAAGHGVTFGTGADFVPRLRELGFPTHQVGISVAEAEASATKAHDNQLDVLFAMFGDILPRRTLADLTPVIAEHRPDLVIYEQSDVGALTAARRAGVPVISHVIGRSLPESVRELANDRLAWLWDGHVPAEPMFGDATLDIWPPSVADPNTLRVPTRIPLRPVAWDVPGALPELRKPLVYLTLGTVAFGKTTVLRAAIDGLATLPVQVLVALGPGDPAELGSVPDNVRVYGFVPQARVLPQADLVVHHGGTGTVLGALAAGLPQLVLPQGADQFVNAELLSAQGVGHALTDITAAAVAEHAGQLLADPTYREAAGRVAKEIAAMPAPSDVLPTLVEFAGHN
jgi:UDP:flavonoid glycosyltransferase YjiC (YdhE family)